jgi:hypothetical protein
MMIISYKKKKEEEENCVSWSYICLQEQPDYSEVFLTLLPTFQTHVNEVRKKQAWCPSLH